MLDVKKHFSRSIGRPGAPLHFAAHSHHPWPDISFEAQARTWIDAAQLLDRKWGMIFETIIPQAQRHVAKQLALPDPSSIVFGPNTHGFLMRILSALPATKCANVISTDGEFHSFTRQINRLAEDDAVNLVRVPVEPFATFTHRFIGELKRRNDWDLVWLSHVFFNSGFVLTHGDLEEILAAIPEKQTLAVIDGYHAFMAIPVDLTRIAPRAFYVAGGYKYAMAGEGACFLHCPPGFAPRPRDTGWYAEFGALEGARGNRVPYGGDGSRFAGATFDPSGLYRFNAVQGWLDGLGLTVSRMDAHCTDLQMRFLAKIGETKRGVSTSHLIVAEPGSSGRFLTFRTADAARIDAELARADIIVDHRDDRLRVGFGIYQDADDVDRLASALETIG